MNRRTSPHPNWRRCGRNPTPPRKQNCYASNDASTIQRLIAALPQPFREAIVLREINDLSYQEIAEVAGVPVGTVMSRLARARSMLRSSWNAAEGTTT